MAVTAHLWQEYSFAIRVDAAGTTPVSMLTYDPDLSRIRIDLSKAMSGAEPAGSYQVVERSTDLVRWAPVRGGGHIPIPES